MRLETLLSFIGAGSGLIGAVAGAAGSVMGYISIRKTRDLKATDLRIELQKAANVLTALIGELPTIFEKLKSAQDEAPLSSLRMGDVLERITLDLQSVQQIQDATLEKRRNLDSLSHAELESRIIAIHQMQMRATAIKERYEAAIEVAKRDTEAFYTNLNRMLTRQG